MFVCRFSTKAKKKPIKGKKPEAKGVATPVKPVATTTTTTSTNATVSSSQPVAVATKQPGDDVIVAEAKQPGSDVAVMNSDGKATVAESGGKEGGISSTVEKDGKKKNAHPPKEDGEMKTEEAKQNKEDTATVDIVVSASLPTVAASAPEEEVAVETQSTDGVASTNEIAAEPEKVLAAVTQQGSDVITLVSDVANNPVDSDTVAAFVPVQTPDPVPVALNVEDNPLDFPPVTEEILKALEVAVHQHRMGRLAEEQEQNQGEGIQAKPLPNKKSPAAGETAEKKTPTGEKNQVPAEPEEKTGEKETMKKEEPRPEKKSQPDKKHPTPAKKTTDTKKTPSGSGQPDHKNVCIIIIIGI